MTEITEKTLKKMYIEYSSTGVNDWQSINTPVGKHLKIYLQVGAFMCSHVHR